MAVKKRMIKIGVTGGPGGGKSKSLGKVAEKLECRGYKVLTGPEAATKLMANGIVIGDSVSLEDFQRYVLREQLHNERLAEMAAKKYEKYYKDVILLCDRGLADQMAYITRDMFETLLEEEGLKMSDAYAYDCIIHMVTAADGAVEFYEWAGNENPDLVNKFRKESPEEAIAKDRLTQNAWVGSTHLKIIDNSTDFPKKILRAVAEIFAVLGEPAPMEIERKFLIKKPTVDEINALGWNSRSDIIQTYLKEQKIGVERRVRQRGTPQDGYKFTYTEKYPVGHGTRGENEINIDMNQYITLLTETDTALHQIVKERYCFLHDNRQFELDLYPFSDEYAVLEIEVGDINEDVSLPALDIIKEVTDDRRYKNHELAKTMTLEL